MTWHSALLYSLPSSCAVSSTPQTDSAQEGLLANVHREHMENHSPPHSPASVFPDVLNDCRNLLAVLTMADSPKWAALMRNRIDRFYRTLIPRDESSWNFSLSLWLSYYSSFIWGEAWDYLWVFSKIQNVGTHSKPIKMTVGENKIWAHAF